MKEEFVNKWKVQVKRGTLPFIVLKALREKELYGYELIESIKEKTSVDIAEGALYTLMNRLKKIELTTSEWIEQKSGIPRKYYRVTEDGKDVLAKMEGYWTELQLSITKP